MNNTPTAITGLTGYKLLHNTLQIWGVKHYAGVTGGGVIHFLKDLPPLTSDQKSGLLSIGEYVAGFIPLGYYLSSGNIAAAIATTGAASKLLCCGLSDAKLHNIPALYLLPLSGEETLGLAPLQDTSVYGSNIVAQLQSELPESVFLLDNPKTLAETLQSAHDQLMQSKPVVLFLLHGALKAEVPSDFTTETNPVVPLLPPDDFYSEFRSNISGHRLIVLAGEEMSRYAGAPELITQLCEAMQCAVIWSINGANAVQRKNKWGYGYISFGGNDEALALYQSLGDNDVLLILGACPDEYTVNMHKFNAAKVFYLTNILNGYGQVNNSFSHMAEKKYRHVTAPLDKLLQHIINEAKETPFKNIPMSPAPYELNHNKYPAPRNGFVDMVELYQRLDLWWPVGSVGFDDVCLAYKDRQYITQRPNDNIKFYSFYRGSAMGGAFGAAVGAKISSPASPVFLFTGDGCFRLFCGSMGEVSELGVVVFLFNNERFSIVSQGLPKILPDTEEVYYHDKLKPLNYCSIAQSCGWETEILSPDLSNLSDILNKINSQQKHSLLIDIPIDSLQLLGANPRLRNL